MFVFLAIFFSMFVIAADNNTSNNQTNERIIEENMTLPEDNETADNETIKEPGEPSLIKTVLDLILDKLSAIKGEIINVKSYLSYENETPIPDKQIDFYANELSMGTETTDTIGLVEILWNTSPFSPGVYIISANYSGDDIFEESFDNVELEIVEEAPYLKLKERLSSASLNKIQKKLWDITTENKSKVLIQLKKDKLRIKEKIKRGKVKLSYDDSLLFAEVYGDEIEDIVTDEDVLKIWPDLEIKSFLDQSVYQIKTDYLWNLNLNGSDIKIAILDTGIDDDHEMLSGRVVLQEDFTGNNYDDIHGHGTHVAGISAGNGNYKGVAYDALLYNGKVLDDSGSGYLSWLINGIDWAIQNNVDIISLSLGATFNGEPEEYLSSPEVLKVEEAISNGITVVIASGNCGSGYCGSFNSVTTPGISRNAITVGAVDDNNEWADFSSGDYISDYIKPDVVAPGFGICSSIPNGYDCYSGTSMATPHVTGSAALLLQYNYSLNPSEIKSMLERTALDLGEEGKNIQYGSGLIDLSNVLYYIPLPEEPVPEKDYILNIPVFETGKEDKVILKYYNKCEGSCNPKKFTIIFDLEELDSNIHEEFTKTIPPAKFKSFSIDFKPTIPGKHLLKITIKDENGIVEEITKAVNVNAKAYSNIIDNVRLVG